MTCDRRLRAREAQGRPRRAQARPRRSRAGIKAERDAHAAVSQLCAQAHKALLAHTRERVHGSKRLSGRAQSRKLKDRLEEMAYKVNGMAAARSKATLPLCPRPHAKNKPCLLSWHDCDGCHMR